jgi:ribonuclease Y
MKVVAEELSTNVQRLAGRMLARTNSRYAPEFIWPKGINHVEIEDPRLGEKLVAPETTLLADLAELTEGVNLSFGPPERPEHKPIIRLGGGFGIYKEAAKLTLEEILPRGPQHWGRLKEVYSKHRGHLEQSAAQLGRRALIDLKLDGMHIEILKMVGALNWRTSYRQNQYYHSIEVSKLAGLLAAELGVDPDAAKRCGLLHDIGKSIDYRIEGSHAVISGDYADRFGESKLICDTVMSHHADLLVETPLAYVLMTADTLSGARPGARVNLEEGYQDRLTSIQDVVRAFPGVVKVEIMNGAREVHVEVNHKKIRENELEVLSQNIARQIEEHVTYPGQIKILVTRRFESVAVA